MHLFDKEVKPHPTWRLIALLVSMVIVGAQTVSGLVYAMSKQVSITDELACYEAFVTYKYSAADIIAEKGITLREGDEMNFASDEEVPDGSEIIISRAVEINVIDGEDSAYSAKTAKNTVGEFIDSKGFDRESVILNVDFDAEIIEGMTISIVHASNELVTLEEIVPYDVTKKASKALKAGEQKVVTEGKEGLSKNTYKVYYENNREVSRELVKTEVIKAPVDKVIEYGYAETKVAYVNHTSGTVVSRNGEVRYKSVLNCQATAYCLKGRTASGMYTQPGVVAVDPRVIPLGTRLYIETTDGSYVYGTAVAADTGGAIKGNIVDLYMPTYNECIQFGRRAVKVYILE